MRKSDIYKLPYNEVTFKASHNSEEREESIIQQLAFNPKKPYDAGCSGIELDVIQSENGWAWCVTHDENYKEDEELQLSTILQEIKKWMDEHSKHRVITIHIDLKNAPLNNTEFPKHIDEYILKIFSSEKIFQPKKLIGDYKNLVSGAQANGWPTLSALEGKIIICFTGDEKRKAVYAKTNPKKRICFSDKLLETNPTQYPWKLSDITRIFMNLKLEDAAFDQFHGQILEIAKQMPYVITRGFVLNNEKIWLQAQRSGLNIMVTDKICHHTWAHNDKYLFRRASRGIRSHNKKIPISTDIKMSTSPCTIVHNKGGDNEQTSSKENNPGNLYCLDY